MSVTALTVNQLPCLEATEVKLQSQMMLTNASVYKIKKDNKHLLLVL